jgi:hypothetical protein
MRDERVDNLRALAMIWVIFNHCIYHLGFFAENHLQDIARSWLLVGTPLFYFVTGASNALASNKRPLNFYVSRFQRILVPYWIYGFIVVVLNCCFYFDFNFFKGLLSWFNPFGSTYSNITFSNWSVWFVPVYLLVITVIPLFKWYKNKVRSKIASLFPAIILAIIVLALNFYTGNSKILFYTSMFALYGFWSYIGLFFNELFCKKRKISALFIIVPAFAVIIILHLFFGQSLNIQDNKFPPNFIFLLYTLVVLGILYIFSGFILKIMSYLKRNSFLRWMLNLYATRSLTIFLFHPFVFLLLNVIKNKIIGFMPDINRLLLFCLIFLLAVPSCAVMGKMFSWIQKIKTLNFK